MVLYPTYPKQLILVRHAESLLNVVHAQSPSFFPTSEARAPFANMPDHKVDLSPKGVTQAIATGIALQKSGYAFSDVIDTGYKRTVQTLDHILDAYPEEERKLIKRQRDISLRERETGYSYCLSRPEADQHFPWMREYWKTFGPVFAKPVGGESLAGTIDRVRMAMMQIFLSTQEKNVLCCLHGRVISAIRYLLDDSSLDDLEEFIPSTNQSNCGVTVYDYSKDLGRLVLTSNNVVHW